MDGENGGEEGGWRGLGLRMPACPWYTPMCNLYLEARVPDQTMSMEQPNRAERSMYSTTLAPGPAQLSVAYWGEPGNEASTSSFVPKSSLQS